LAETSNLHPATGKLLRKLTQERKRRKLSRYRLSQLTGVSQQMIGYVEKGERVPSLDLVCRLAAGLGMSLEFESVRD
jgi:transcriptional regulator with XRE-family HTH domain